MLIKLNHNNLYEIQYMCSLFFSGEKVEILKERTKKEGDIIVKSFLYEKENFYISKTSITINNFTTIYTCKSKTKDEKAINNLINRSFYFSALKQGKKAPPYGIIIGIRPTKIAIKYLNEGKSEKEVAIILKNNYLVRQDKIELLLQTAKYSNMALLLTKKNSVSIYISVPFCPSRCKYCSFVSHSIEKTYHLIEPYLEKLCIEIKETAKLIISKALIVESIYIGGGTPTILSPIQLEKLLFTIKTNFNINLIREITLEAGRPDTIDSEKLRIINSIPNIRICINPQSLNDEVLLEIGRAHNSKQFFDAYNKAKEETMKNINVDLIIGLPKDTFFSFRKTLISVIKLKPTNITLHSLCVKRASTYTGEGKTNTNNEILAEKMQEYAIKKLYKTGYIAYYIYKQRNTADNLENIGFCLNGSQCLYNIFMMEELHTVIGIGAGAVTKIVNQNNNQINRLFNPKYPYEYLERFENLLEQKNKLGAFYDTY